MLDRLPVFLEPKRCVLKLQLLVGMLSSITVVQLLKTFIL